jgi:hypothetical protein
MDQDAIAPAAIAPAAIAPAAIAEEIMRQVAARGIEHSICPSEVARALNPDWRQLLAPVRRVIRLRLRTPRRPEGDGE